MANLNDGKIVGNIQATSDEQEGAGPHQPDAVPTQNGEDNSQSPSDVQSQSDVAKPTIADRLVKYARARATLFHTPENEAYATITKDGHRETWPIKSPEFERWVARNFFLVEKKVAYSQAVRSALNTLEGLALFGPSTQKVHLRYAEHKRKIYVDLANKKWEVVEVDTKGWRVIRDSPVRFVRAPGMRPLPIPVRDGSIEELRPFLNLRRENEAGEPDDRDWTLFVACLVVAMRPAGPYPILLFLGEYGSAKSTIARVFRRLLDPAEPAHRAPPKDARDLMVSAYNNWVVAFDNLSTLPTWLSDGLCRLATGAGFSSRQLYTDRKEANIVAARPVLLNSITSIATRLDFLSRAVILNLPRISRKNRRDEETFWHEFDRVHPLILGALFDAVSHGLRRFGRTRLKEMPRMADFARWVTACEGAFGWPPGTFMKAYRDHEAEKVELALAESWMAQPIRELAAKGWEGTARKLAVKIASMLPGRPQPKDERIVSNELRQLEPDLRKTGVVVTRRRGHGGVRLIRLSGDDGDDGDAEGGNSSVVKKKGKRKKRVKKRVRKGDKPASPASPTSPTARAGGQQPRRKTQRDTA